MSNSVHTQPAAAGAAHGQGQDQAQSQAQTAAAYSYGQYATTGAYGQHAQTLTPYPTTYQTPYATGITGYGSWPYAYSYVAQQPHTYASKPATSSPVAVPSTSQVGPQRTTFTTYSTPSAPYRREAAQTSSASGSGTVARGPRKQANFKGLFAKELKSLMYGFGDDRNPASDTVNVMEEILVEYICDVCQTAGGPSRKTRLSIEDLRRALSRPPDAKKLARMEELLFMQEDIQRARAQFEDSDMQSRALQS